MTERMFNPVRCTTVAFIATVVRHVLESWKTGLPALMRFENPEVTTGKKRTHVLF